MQKPRLAIMLAGHMRSYQLTLQSFLLLRESLREKYECKTFIHTWDLDESSTPSYYDRPDSFNLKEIHYADIVEKYLPDGILIESQPDREDRLLLNNQSLSGLLNAECSKYKVNQIKKNYGEFDYSLLIRPDVHFYRTELPEINSEYFYLGSVRHNSAACDVISFSSSSNMDKARDYHLVHHDYLKSFNMMNNEAYYLKYLNEAGFEIKFADYCMPRDWKIVRSWWPSVDYYESDRKTWDRSYAG